MQVRFLNREGPRRGLILVLGILLFAGAASADRFLAVRAEIAPRKVEAGARATLRVTLEINPPYHIHANPSSFDYLIPATVEVEPTAGLRFKPALYPAGRRVATGGFPEPILVYDGRIMIAIPVEVAADHHAGRARIRGAVSYQACDNQACFPPKTLPFEVALEVKAPRAASAPAAIAETSRPLQAPAGTGGFAPIEATAPGFGAPAEERVAVSLAPAAEESAPSATAGGGLLAWIIAAFLGGLALNLTPCVYPLIPITIGYFARQGHGGRGRTVFFSLLYVLAMAIVYAILGGAAALTGAMFGRFLQQTAVLVGIAAIMVFFAAGMMGGFEIRLPAAFDRLASARPGPVGALTMGATVGLVAAPCIGPFIVTLLAHVGVRGDPVEGFLLFLALGLGLGAPYIPLAILSHRLAAWPRAGSFLVAAKRLLGIALLGIAAWFLLPVVGARLFQLIFAGVLVAGGGVTLFQGIEGESRGTKSFRRLAALVLVAGGFAVFGRGPGATPIEWKTFSKTELALAAEAGQPAIVDVHADWCLPCHKLEGITFADESVRAAFAGMRLLKADVTGPAISPEVEALMAREAIQGVPTILFYDAAGRERADLRLVGFEGPAAFRARLEALRREAP